MGILRKICDHIDSVWEDYIYDPATKLPALFEVTNIDYKWLKYLKPLLGFTTNLYLGAIKEAELRRLLTLSIPFWSKKPSELGIIENPIRMVSGNNYRTMNFFDYRMVTDELILGEEMGNFDPWCIDFWGKVARGLTVHIADGDPRKFTIEAGLPLGIFFTTYDYRYLVIEDGIAAKTYAINACNPYSTYGTIIEDFPVGSEGEYAGSLYGAMDEYLSEVRLVDDSVGILTYNNLTSGTFYVGDIVTGVISGATGVITTVNSTSTLGSITLKHVYKRFVSNEIITSLPGAASATVEGELDGVMNRKLLRSLIEVVRPLSERVRIVYIDLLDEFKVVNDLDQWAVTGDATVPNPGGSTVLVSGGRIVTNALYAEDWGDATIYWKITLADNTSVFRGLFRYIDANNHYALQLSMATKKLRLIKCRLGVETTLAETSMMPWLKANVADVIRVDVINMPSYAVHFKVTFDGEPVFASSEPEDASSTFLNGKVGASCTAGSASLRIVEAAVWPIEADHVGPPPTEITYPGLPD